MSVTKYYQFGFMRGKSTTEQLFSVKRLVDACGEKTKKPCTAFIDEEKAYDRVQVRMDRVVERSVCGVLCDKRISQ